MGIQALCLCLLSFLSFSLRLSFVLDHRPACDLSPGTALPDCWCLIPDGLDVNLQPQDVSTNSMSLFFSLFSSPHPFSSCPCLLLRLGVYCLLPDVELLCWGLTPCVFCFFMVVKSLCSSEAVVRSQKLLTILCDY